MRLALDIDSRSPMCATGSKLRKSQQCSWGARLATTGKHKIFITGRVEHSAAARKGGNEKAPASKLLLRGTRAIPEAVCPFEANVLSPEVVTFTS